jgi:ABC-type glutathione transport system ATPase component
LALRQVKISFPAKDENCPAVTIDVPELNIKRGAKVGILGPSGAGKTTILQALLNMVPFKGSYSA